MAQAIRRKNIRKIQERKAARPAIIAMVLEMVGGTVLVICLLAIAFFGSAVFDRITAPVEVNTSQW
jgi:Zn-dependent membrane protease YugP